MRRAAEIAAFVAGGLFAAGLAIGGMAQPSKVRGFLDFTGVWDPSLLFVMGGAVGTYALLYRLLLPRGRPVFDERFHVPTRKDIDLRLVAGAAIFGVGWGLAGYCPGPALTSLGTGTVAPVVFVLAMAAGIGADRMLDIALARRRAVPPVPSFVTGTKEPS